METKVVTRINGVEILASNVSDGLVAIKPVCTGLGVDYSSQYQKLKEHPTFNSTISLITTVAADGKQKELRDFISANDTQMAFEFDPTEQV